MAKNDNLKDFLTDIADVIREKKGTTDLINPQNFSAEIASIQSGGGAVAVSAKAVNFRDYDGTILHSYTKDEFLALTELPPLPTREGLICQEWNWDYADAVEYVSEYGVLEVGATYITDDGKTRLYITIAAEGRMAASLYFNQTVEKGVTIDWGDGSATETLNGTGNVNITHNYNAIGDYVISLNVADGCTLGLGRGDNSYCVIGNAVGKGLASCNMLTKAIIGKGVTTIDTYAFNNCRSLSSVSIPKGITTIGTYAFNSCYSLLSVSIPKGATMGAYAFNACSTLSSVSIPKGITTIGTYTFYYCQCISLVVIPEGVVTIGSSSFYYCQCISMVVIPKGVTTINSQAFRDCPSVGFYDFSSLESVPTLSNSNAFQNIASDCKIIVPDVLYNEWIAATNWSSSTTKSKIIKKSDWDALNA